MCAKIQSGLRLEKARFEKKGEPIFRIDPKEGLISCAAEQTGKKCPEKERKEKCLIIHNIACVSSGLRRYNEHKDEEMRRKFVQKMAKHRVDRHEGNKRDT